MPAWLVFLLSGAMVAIAGTRLARDGDRIAEETGLGGLWVGAILVAAATSLPELLTDASAIRQGHAGLAVGDLFGSSMANMMILAVADLATPRVYILTRVGTTPVLVGLLAISLTSVAASGVVLHSQNSVLGFGPAVLVIGVMYLAGMRLLHRNRADPTQLELAGTGRPAVRDWSRLRGPVAGFALSAAAILAAAPFLARSTAAVAEQLGITEGFAGIALLAFTTSLPEAAVTIASVRTGTYALLVGNLLGSNCFNMAALVPLDLVHGRGPLLGAVEPALALSALVATLMMGLVLLDISNRSPRRRLAVEPGPGLLALTYVIGIVLVYQLSH